MRHSQRLKLTGAAILVCRASRSLQPAPAAYPYRSAREGTPMRAAVAVACLCGVSLLAGCGGERQPGPPVPLKSFTLDDVQGLFGGHALWVAEDRTAFVQVVGPPPAGQSGLWDKRYKTKLT